MERMNNLLCDNTLLTLLLRYYSMQVEIIFVNIIKIYSYN